MAWGAAVSVRLRIVCIWWIGNYTDRDGYRVQTEVRGQCKMRCAIIIVGYSVSKPGAFRPNSAACENLRFTDLQLSRTTPYTHTHTHTYTFRDRKHNQLLFVCGISEQWRGQKFRIKACIFFSEILSAMTPGSG